MPPPGGHRFLPPARRRLVALAVALTACVAPAPGEPDAGPVLRVSGRVALLERLDEAAWAPPVVNLNHPRVKAVQADLGDGPVAALFCHPQAAVTWRLRLEGPAVLETAVGLLPEAWTRSGDGAGFRVTVADPKETTLLQTTLDPRRDAAARGWVPVQVDLSPWAGREVALTLATDTGPGHDPGWDWAVWRDPVLAPR